MLLATLALWMRSYFIADELSLELGNVEAHCFSYCSRFQFEVVAYDRHYEPDYYWGTTPIKNIFIVALGPLFRFKVGGDPYMGLVRVKPILAFNFPMPVAVAASVLALFFALRHRPRHLENHCKSCGYNLTANVSGVCPECGSKVPA